MRRNKTDVSNNLNLQLFTPGSGWSAPVSFPELSGVRLIGIDLETHDPLLHARGPGGIRRDGAVAGVSISTNDAGWYFPYGHLGGGNMDPEGVRRFLGDVLKNSELTCVGANIPYELEWLAHEGIRPRAKFLDVQIAEALLDEERDAGFDLDTLAIKYLGRGKDETLLRDAAKAFNVDPKSGLWKLHSKYVGPYAVFDSYAPLKIFEKQTPLMEKDGLGQIFDLETRLTPILWKMREQGVPVDLEVATESSKILKDKEDIVRLELRNKIGYDVDVWSGPQLGRMCDDRGISYPRTPKGAPSFEGEFLERSEERCLQLISEIRELDRLRTTFIDKWIFKNEINGRIHPVWKQLMSDDGGTRTGRMAASNPNPQQVPSRSDLAYLIRKIFVPDPGKKWCKADYSQQEPRLLIHYASLCNLTGASLIREAYRANPKLNFYTFISEAANMAKFDAKTVSLGRMYGMGYKKYAKKYGCSEQVAKKKLEDYDDHFPFVKELADKCSNQAQRRGYIKTLCGRKRHFNYWEPCDAKALIQRGINCMPQEHAIAVQRWPDSRLQRSHTHKALNSLIQGSAADMTKQAILNMYEGHGILPYLAVHDETDVGVVDKQEETIKKIMETCVETQVPILVEMSVGEHWS